VKVTDVLAHTVVAVAVIVMLTGKLELITMVIEFEVAGLPVAHGVMFEVNTQVTTSLFAGV
jgi:hypothetical protein